MHIKPQTSLQKREKLLEGFYRSELRKELAKMKNKWEKTTGQVIREIQIKKMKTKWGTSNRQDHRIWLNLELAKKPPKCIEYVLVHEITHFMVKNHTEEFKELLKSFMPNWIQVRKELNKNPLGYHRWDSFFGITQKDKQDNFISI
jgi:predicted metal-dependent hydrolase